MEALTKELLEQKNSQAIADLIEKGTDEIHQQNLKQLQKDNIHHLNRYGVEAPAVLAERERLADLKRAKEIDKTTLQNVMNAIELSNKVDETRASYEHDVEVIFFDKGIKEFGAEKFMATLAENPNDPMQTYATLNGHKNIMEYMDWFKKEKEEYQYTTGAKKDHRELAKQIGEAVAEALKKS